jgi:pimeloyl-ACP methyl ester carboxylesterase
MGLVDDIRSSLVSLVPRGHRARLAPIVLLHGNGDSPHGWAPLIGHLHRPSRRPALPGFGGAPLLHEDATLDDYAEAMAASLPRRPVTLVGQSFGGAIAALMAEQNPHRVAELVLLAPGGFGTNALAQTLATPTGRAVSAAVGPLMASAAVYSTMLNPGHRPSAELADRLSREREPHGPGRRAATAALLNAERTGTAPFQRRMTYEGPVRALFGRRDLLVPSSHAAGVRNALPQAEITVWPGAGHLPQHETPERLAAWIEGREAGEQALAA